ncbi:hypothetical protein MO973_36560 [Paenibacillus sp. TRM 82003]|uniref:hypothetical protein n=1 Tax=Kineococcus sp. TRM81007 TaxID=2925831 RepID=UPI001F58D1FD|nr:hypothetical protein [Kineococcus sp. TRM81007]MCI2239970.1 hypothetical protein [Kineococcus sp. TRM81007]MCI3925725.1 hypothetical protein [Paenibacillus sp. TRM 82003]
MAQRKKPRPRPAPPAPPPVEVAQPSSTAAVAATVAAGLSLLCSLVFFPLAVVMALVVLVLSVRALARRAPYRGWWATATAVSAFSLVTSALGIALLLAAR